MAKITSKYALSHAEHPYFWKVTLINSVLFIFYLFKDFQTLSRISSVNILSEYKLISDVNKFI